MTAPAYLMDHTSGVIATNPTWQAMWGFEPLPDGVVHFGSDTYQITVTCVGATEIGVAALITPWVEQSHTDALTGLYNRRAYTEDIQAHQAQSHRRPEHTYTICCIDMDGLKTLNDTLGHTAGDRAICAIATYLKGAVRAEDRVYRLGGDEFVVLCVGHLPTSALTRIQSGCPHPISVGCSTVSYEEADLALYRDKVSRKTGNHTT